MEPDYRNLVNKIYIIKINELILLQKSKEAF